MTPKLLTNRDYCEAAKDLMCEVAAIMAVASVESSGGGYDDLGRIKVRFEGHKFREYTYGKFDQTHSHLSYPYKQQKFKNHGYSAFSEAFALDAEAALKASSFGKFQPLAANYREAGFTNVRDFVDFLRESEANQLKVFVLMVKFRHIDDELRRKDWAGFAENYNGSAYRDNDYDGKMHRAYDHYKTLKINCNQLLLDEREIDNLLIRFDKDIEPTAKKIDSNFPKTPISTEAVQSSEPVESPNQTSSLPQQSQSVQNPIDSTAHVPDSPESLAIPSIGYIQEAVEKIGKVQESYDYLKEISSGLNDAKDSAKSLWTTISQTFFQMIWAVIAFFLGLPPWVWISVMVIVAAFGLFYLYRQIELGKLREVTKQKFLERS